MNLLIDNRPDRVPLSKACDALAINRSTLYWRRGRQDLSEEQKQANRSRKHCQQTRSLTPEERNRLLTLFNSDEFVDQPPMEIYHTLLERGENLCSMEYDAPIIARKQAKRGSSSPACAAAPCYSTTLCHTAERGMELGLFQTAYAHNRGLSHALRCAGFIQSVRGGMDGLSKREQCAGATTNG